MRRRARFQRCNLPGFRGAGRFLFSLRGERKAFRRRDTSDVLAPKLKRGSLFGFIPATIVNRGDSPDHAGPMVQAARLDHMRLNAKARHAARGRATKIVKRKGGRNALGAGS